MKPPHTALCAVLALSLFPAAGAPVPPSAARAAAPAAIESEASLEYYIGLASKLAQGDHNAELRALKNALDALLAEKKALAAKLLTLEEQVAGAEAGGDGAKAQALQSAIQALQASLAQIDVDVQKLVNEIQKLRDDANRTQDEAKRGVDLLHGFAAALTENPPRDPYVKTLSSPARAAALAKAREGGDALGSVARAAGLTAASANSALTAAADTRGKLVAVRIPPPTPTTATRPAIRVISTGVK